MGWTPWNTVETGLTDDYVRAEAAAMVSNGMAAAGYTLVIGAEDGFEGAARDSNGNMTWDATKFPHGIAELNAFLHSQGLTAGIYSAPGATDCNGHFGSFGHEVQDAQTFASWKVDYLFYDLCGSALSDFENAAIAWGPTIVYEFVYGYMAQALQATGWPVVFAGGPAGALGEEGYWADSTATLCDYANLGMNMNRTGVDIAQDWDSVADIMFNLSHGTPSCQGPGHWHDPDALLVGFGLTDTEGQSQMSFWSILAAPLIVGSDLTTLTSISLATLTNSEVIAVDQDPQGIEGQRVSQVSCGDSYCEVWVKQLSYGAWAIGLFNRASTTQTVSTTWTTINGVFSGFPVAPFTTTRDLWAHSLLGTLTSGYSVSVPSHGAAMIKLFGPVGLSSSGLSFANQLLGTTSAAQTVTVTNTGSETLIFSGVASSGDFGETTTCSGSLAVGATCTIGVTFTPSAAGPRTGTLTMTDSNNGTSDNTQTLGLTGTGVAPAAELSVPSLNFGNQLVGATSRAQSLTLTNSGSAPLTITAMAISGDNASDFAETSACGSSVAAGASCTISVGFTPSTTGTRSGTLTITDNHNAVAGSTQTVNLCGMGTLALLRLSPPSLSFGIQPVSTTTVAQPETVTNTGTANLSISTVTIGGTNGSDFATSVDTCTGVTVTPNGSCTVSVTFTPTASGPRKSSVSITDNAQGSPQTLILTAVGTAASFSPPSANFGGQNVGTSSAPHSVTLTNQGSAPMNLWQIALSGANAGDFSETTTCGGSLGASLSCTLTVTFTPTSTGPRTASLLFSDDGGGSPQAVALSGTGMAAASLSLSTSALSFGAEPIGEEPVARSVGLTNSGNLSLAIGPITVVGSSQEFVQTNTCGPDLAPGANCTVKVVFRPLRPGGRTAKLMLFHDGVGSVSVALSGTGVLPLRPLVVPRL